MDSKRENLLLSSLPRQLLSIDEELWRMTEERIQEILWTIQPNVLSEMNRKNVLNYVQKLIGDYYDTKVFPFGSFPLKTYLPDGDIDLTVINHEDEEENLAKEICTILECANDLIYQVKDIEHIRAQVQVVKCTVKNIPIDITFNQMTGLCTLCFLEQQVLYIFFDYYGTFDWEHNYMSIWGPKALSSLPEIVDRPECDQDEFLLHKEFLINYRDIFSSKAKSSETTTNTFPVKHINILDPLRNDNNLGRSVNEASFHRIRFALSYGAKKFKQIFTLAGENMGEALEKFFFDTLQRNGKGERADVDVPVSPFGTGRYEKSVLDGDCDSYYGGSQYAQQYPNYAMPTTTIHSNSPSSPSQDDILALSTQQNWSEGDLLALSTQQNWSMYYQSVYNGYIPGQTLFHPTYNFEEGGRSRGTGTYIPDLNYNCYWDIRAKVNRPRRFPSAKHNALLKSCPKRKEAEEVHFETNMNDNSKPFELSNEDFPLILGIRKATSPTQAQESAPFANVHSETNKDGGNSRFYEPSNETHAKEPALLAKVLSKTDKPSNPWSFELVKEDFPLLPKVCSEPRMDDNSKSFDLSKKDFPPLQRSHKIVPSKSNQPTKYEKISSSSKESKLKNVEFGTHKLSQSLAEQSMSTKGEKEISGVSSSQETKLVVPKVAL
ncbi:Poly(A) RNA polymerase cid14 [Glycine max]|nr:Poly(A) RNA polymerase cid14 [Glycine max]